MRSTKCTFIDELTASELYKTLSRRQQQCVDLLMDGYNREEIGRIMGIKHRVQVNQQQVPNRFRSVRS